MKESIVARIRLNWYQTAINLAFDIAGYRSEDPYTQCGACAILDDGKISLGYNGPPRRVNIDWTDRVQKNIRVLHAEYNALDGCLPGTIKLLAVTLLPCTECMKKIAHKLVPEVVYTIEHEKYNPDLTKQLASEFGVKLIKLQPSTLNLLPIKYK